MHPAIRKSSPYLSDLVSHLPGHAVAHRLESGHRASVGRDLHVPANATFGGTYRSGRFFKRHHGCYTDADRIRHLPRRG
jgi:hypothetical protein